MRPWETWVYMIFQLSFQCYLPIVWGLLTSLLSSRGVGAACWVVTDRYTLPIRSQEAHWSTIWPYLQCSRLSGASLCRINTFFARDQNDFLTHRKTLWPNTLKKMKRCYRSIFRFIFGHSSHEWPAFLDRTELFHKLTSIVFISVPSPLSLNQIEDYLQGI